VDEAGILQLRQLIQPTPSYLPYIEAASFIRNLRTRHAIVTGTHFWMGHVVRMGDNRNAYKVLYRIMEGKKHLENLGIDDRVKLKYSFRK